MKTIEPNFMNSFYAKKMSLLARSQKLIGLFDILYFHFRFTYNLILIQLNWPLMSTQAMKPNSANKNKCLNWFGLILTDKYNSFIW
jgi:hypothetical protein